MTEAELTCLERSIPTRPDPEVRATLTCLCAEIRRLREALEHIASDEPFLRQDHAAVEVADEALDRANRAQFQQAIARAG